MGPLLSQEDARPATGDIEPSCTQPPYSAKLVVPVRPVMAAGVCSTMKRHLLPSTFPHDRYREPMTYHVASRAGQSQLQRLTTRGHMLDHQACQGDARAPQVTMTPPALSGSSLPEPCRGPSLSCLLCFLYHPYFPKYVGLYICKPGWQWPIFCVTI